MLINKHKYLSISELATSPDRFMVKLWVAENLTQN
jgi:hypothetical protein